MRWRTFLPLPFLLGLAVLFARLSLSPGGARIQIEWHLVLAFCTALRTPPGHRIAAFWYCGFMYDLFLGHRLGASTLLYAFAALPVAGPLTHSVRERHSVAAAAVFGLTVFVQTLRVPLEQATVAPLLAWSAWREILLGAALTALVSPLALALLRHPWLRTWREDGAPYPAGGR